MKKLLWTSAMALTAVACLTACDDSSSGASNSIPTYKTESALPDTCEMEVAKAGDTYFACFDNKWVEVTDSATIEKFKEGLDEEDLKEQLEELEDMMAKLSSSSKKPSSSSKKVESSDDEGEEEVESSSSEEECTGRRCKTGNSSSSKKSSGGNDSGEGGDGSSPSSAESSSPSSAETSSPSSAESSSPSSAETSSPSSAESSSPSSAETSSPSSAESSSPSSSATSASSSSGVAKCGGVAYDPTKQFCDTRGSGTIYKFVTIGTQTWMAENLKYVTASGSYCNPNVENFCDIYGLLYDWDAAMDNACPSGWHIPSPSDFETLFNTLDENGEDIESETGFHALVAGWYRTNGDTWYGPNDGYTGWWTDEEYDDEEAYRYAYYDDYDTNDKVWGNSVRCIKNAE